LRVSDTPKLGFVLFQLFSFSLFHQDDHMSRIILTICLVFSSLGTLFAQEESTEVADTSAGLPKEYADYLVASKTLSPDKKFAVIYPKTELCPEGSGDRCKDYLVALQPFQVLTVLDTKWPEFEHKNRGGMSASWLKDGSAVLVTVDSRWGPGDIFLYEIGDGKLSRSTNLLKKVHDLLAPDYKKARVGRYNDNFDFVFETEDYDHPMCEFADSTHVRIRATATTEPKGIAGDKAWDGAVEAIWDIPNAKFASQKVTRKFAGVRKESDL
jgi:hypothetical protein